MEVESGKSANSTAAHTMVCAEVWGGNEPVDRGVVMQGLDAFVCSRPYDGADEGGDIHYVSSCASGRITRILLADVSGHGIEVAQVARRLRSLMRRFVNYVDQSKLTGLINQEFARLSSGGHFATAIVATCWGPTREVAVTNAGHPPPLLYLSREGAWSAVADGERLEGTGPSDLPLGVLDDTAYGRAKFRMNEGDVLVMYTDALIEAKRPDGTLLGVQGLLDVIGKMDASKPERLAADLIGAVVATTSYQALDDDATVMVLRVNDLVVRGSIWNGVLASWRIAREAMRALESGDEGIAWPEFNLRNILGSFVDALNRR
jgi:sigma-B regulation protein RsbU (phosphoserine phosphatase)